ncbi:hypothetical protein HPB49_016569 [Dermacentor silvarum]|uniref:Uncharacterized protein n=1 Tax=Dermacentor silvarum TaxID=543639 RepID=A0ACB8CRW6_DERSI|nr:hypothetical protein HPB49_016569 [Dermacentor silvarum]
MKVAIEGIPISREELAASDWLTKVNKLRVARTTPGQAVPDLLGDKAGPDQPPQNNKGQASGAPARKKASEPTPRQRGRLLAKKSVASNQPRLPSNALKLIVRPRGGLLLSKISTYQLLEAICMAARFTRDAVRHQDLIQANLIQNTFAYCTPDVQRAEQVLRLKAITIDNKEHEVSVCCAPDDSSGRGVIRGVDLRLDRDAIQAELQDDRNPAMGPQVPTWVYFCNSRHRCNLFKKKYEVCYHCGELGHRADVCASPTTKCRGCGLSNPPNDHTCKPTCRLCGEEHFTGDSRCKEIYRIPYTVKRRQWENYRQAEANILKAQEPAKQVTLQHTSLWDRHRSGSRQRQPRGPLELLSIARVYHSPGAVPDSLPEPTRATCSHPAAPSLFSSSAAATWATAISAHPTRTSTTVDALEKRTASHTPSPPAPQVPPTAVPMEITPSSRATHKRKAPADNDPPAEDWQARLDRLEQKYELSQTHIRALEAHIERSLHTIGSQIAQQIETLSKTIEAQGKPEAVAELADSAPPLPPTPKLSQVSHGGQLG